MTSAFLLLIFCVVPLASLHGSHFLYLWGCTRKMWIFKYHHSHICLPNWVFPLLQTTWCHLSQSLKPLCLIFFICLNLSFAITSLSFNFLVKGIFVLISNATILLQCKHENSLPASFHAFSEKILQHLGLKGRFFGHTTTGCEKLGGRKKCDAGAYSFIVPPCSKITLSMTMCSDTLTDWFKLPESSCFCQIWNVPFLTQHFNPHCNNRKSFFSVTSFFLLLFSLVAQVHGPIQAPGEENSPLHDAVLVFASKGFRFYGSGAAWFLWCHSLTCQTVVHQEYLLDVAAKQMPSSNRTNFASSCLCLHSS